MKNDFGQTRGPAKSQLWRLVLAATYALSQEDGLLAEGKTLAVEALALVDRL